MFPVPIETLRERIGLDAADASRDDDIAAANAVAFALMANYCDRHFDEVLGGLMEYTHVSGESVSLPRYPVTQIISALDENGGDFTSYHLGVYTGIIHFDLHKQFHTLLVTYDAGYAEGEFPADLLTAYYAIFDEQIVAIETGSTVAVTSVESVTVADVGTVRYGSSGSSGGTSGFMPAISSSILDAYKRYQA